MAAADTAAVAVAFDAAVVCCCYVQISQNTSLLFNFELNSDIYI